MLPIALLVSASLAYLLVLFLVADRAERQPGRWLQSPWVYSLSLGALFTGWGYFGTGATLLNQGVTILASAIGASLFYLLGWPFALRAIRLAKRHHVSTLPALLSVRYGRSPGRSAALAGVLLFCTLPYVTLQLEAIALAFNTLAHGTSDTHRADSSLFVLFVTLGLALFACLFGARRSDPTTRHEGVVLALAIDGVFKLAALVAVVAWLFATHDLHLFAGSTSATFPQLSDLGPPANTLANWIGLLLIPFAASLLVPHMFHLAIVENSAPRQLALARWGFPLHYWLLFACSTLIALAGARLGLPAGEVGTAVLRLPMQAGASALALFAYLGGVSASACMAIVALIALANIAVLEWWVPLAVRTGWRFEAHLRALRWLTITALALGAWGLWIFSRVGFLPEFGLLSLSAIAQFAPATLLGLVWSRPSARALGTGLGVGLALWFYCAFLPIFAQASPAIAQWVAHGPWGIDWLKPHGLFGLAGWNPYAQAIFWSLGLNTFVFLATTLATRRDPSAEARARELVEDRTGLPAASQALAPIRWEDLAGFAARFVEPERAEAELARVRREVEARQAAPDLQLLVARTAVERLVSGPLGAETAHRLVQERWPVAVRTVADIFGAYQELEETLALNREDLTNRVRELSFLNAASERLVETDDPHALLSSVCALLQDTFRLDLAGALLWDGQTATFACQDGLAHPPSGPFTVPDDSPLAAALAERRPRHVTAASPEAALDAIFSAEQPKELVYAPMITAGRTLGALVCGVKHSPVFLSAGFIDLVQALANELAVALAAAQLRRKSAEVRGQLEATLRNLADAVLVVDRDMRIRLFNEAFMRIVGTSDAGYFDAMTLPALVGHLQTQTLDGTPIPPARYAELLATSRALQGSPANAAFRITNLLGEPLILSLSSMPIVDAHGEVQQVVTVYRDITELYALQKNLESRVAERTEELATERDRLKEANQKLESVVTELRALEKLKGTFINAISHDLRIPLTGIVGYAEFIEDGIGGEPTPQQQEFAHQITVLSERMTKLLNELLDFARMEAGKFKIEPRPIALSAPIEEALQGFRPVYRKKGVALESVIAPMPALEADPDRLVQVLSNLLSNAIKFTPAGGTVTVRAERDGDEALVSVTDTGIGIAPEALPHMFERFFQTEAGRKAGGTGLGLSICKALVEAHGGTLGVTSVPGEGSTFWFRLPLSQALDGADVVQ